MKRHVFLAVFLILIPGCATFKELEPEPPVIPLERGYIELKDDEDQFELDKDGKYFIKFPGPSKDRFNLVIVTSSKPLLHTYLTTSFDDGKGQITPIADDASSSDSILVYKVDAQAPTFFWVIEDVRQDLVLSISYRYVPQWRYTFENKYAEYKEVLAGNRVDRSTYNSIDANFDLEKIDVAREITGVEQRSTKISFMENELTQLEKVFPPDIAASRDTAYEQYVALRKGVDDELSFQENYSAILNLFKKEKETRGNTAMFLESAPYFTGVLSEKDRFTPGVRAKAAQVLTGRLSEMAPYFENLLRSKGDITAISPAPSAEVVGGLYRACGQQTPPETENVIRFVNRFNAEVEGLKSSNSKFQALKTFFASHILSPPESFYADLLSKATELRGAIPEHQTGRFERYGNYPCTAILGRELANAANRATELLTMYQTSGIVAGQIRDRSWAPAEQSLRGLYETRGLSESPDIPTQRLALVKRFEDELLSGVKSASEQRINAFIKAHEMAIDNVAELYMDSAFLPVHQLTFSSGGGTDVLQKRKQVEGYLDHIKYFQFPESSIKSIYGELTRSMRDRGVEKARAIVEHGKFYRGEDKQVKGLITECDVQIAKWVVRPKEYRKVFALPVTSNKQGVNEYMFRIRLEIPTEAQFPVFDVNVKLPQEIAEKAGEKQWYESITIDKKPIKNEGRFRITSPTAANNYEALITPVQMDKEGRHVLEVRFNYPGFRVFEVSAMAQVPIIRKN
ncbi:MAG: hypothetical protein HW407_132 [Bacteroidetes bacterium]|nr:hypothetical protein [Bacteroidota bacterium]